MKTAFAQIRLTNLQHNLELLKRAAPTSKIIAICKANGYGHGLVAVAKALHKADALGVARIQEAVSLRDAGIVQPIMLLEGCFDADELQLASNIDVEVVVHHTHQLTMLQQTQLTHPVKVWLKLDTGMYRLGIDHTQFNDCYQALSQCHNVRGSVHIMSHLSCADELGNQYTDSQLQQFEQITQPYDAPKSLANSAAVLAHPNTHFDWVRPGLSLYGISPLPTGTHISQQLKPVMTLHSRLISVKPAKAGALVGYGGAGQLQQDSTLGVIAIGYGDGYPRNAPNGTPVLINGRIVPSIGKVSMDMLTVDLGTNSQDQIGDKVTLWGEGLPVEQVANHIGTIPWELVCRLTQRLALVYN